MNQIKYNSLCPYYAHHMKCPDEVLKNYCCFQHNRYARRTELCAAELNDEGRGISDLQINLLCSDRTCDLQERAFNKLLWRKFPNEPSEEAKIFLSNIFDNQKNRDIYKEI